MSSDNTVMVGVAVVVGVAAIYLAGAGVLTLLKYAKKEITAAPRNATEAVIKSAYTPSTKDRPMIVADRDGKRYALTYG